MSTKPNESGTVVMVSGGIDSAVCLGMALERFDRVKPVHVQYGQQTGDIEKFNARQIVQWAMAQSEQNEEYADEVMDLSIVDYQAVFSHFADGVADPNKDFDHLVEDDGRSAGYVPMRNLHLIATGAAFADDIGLDSVLLGPQAGDEADYPDCREEFLNTAHRAVNESVPEDQSIVVDFPILFWSKEDVITAGERYNVPWQYTYSCYTELDVDIAESEPEPCGECPACVEREEAFETAGVEDPYMG